MKQKLPLRHSVHTTQSSRRSILCGHHFRALRGGDRRPMILLGALPVSTAANSKMNLVVVGCGGQGRGDMRGMLSWRERRRPRRSRSGADRNRPGPMRGTPGQGERRPPKPTKTTASYWTTPPTFDAVLIATPDHWHAPLCKAFMKLGKHVYCEKPLTHSVAEARELRELARSSKVATQMGNQGTASASLRRCAEIIKAGALGQVREIYHWGIGVHANEGRARGEDRVPAGFNWDLWVGPSAMWPFKKRVYHPFACELVRLRQRRAGRFRRHAINLPMRALDLGYPERLVVNMKDGKQTPGKPALSFHFPGGKLLPLTLHWQGDGRPPAAVIEPLVDGKQGPRAIGRPDDCRRDGPHLHRSTGTAAA